ncbi:MAG: hypothetical protein ABW026_11880 [Microvirga sp.]
MPRYFLHVRDGVDIALDPKGRDFANIAVAEVEARKVVRELLANWPSGWPDVTADLIVAIDDSSGQTLSTIPFSRIADPASSLLDVP